MTSTPSDPTPEQGATPPPPPLGAVPPPAYNAPPPGYAAPPPGYAAPAAPLSDSDQRMWAMLAHLGGIILYFVPALVIWLVNKERGRFVEEQSKEALNFQLTLLIAYIVGWVTTFIFIGFLILAAAGITSLIFSIIAGMAANKGQAYRYPFAIRLIK